MLSSRRLQATLLIVAVMVAGFGLYAGFHALDAHGDGTAVHNNTIKPKNTVIGTSTSTTAKPCRGASADEPHNNGYITKTTVTQKCKLYTHRHLNWQLQWVVQYTRLFDCTLETKTSSYWDVCHYRNYNGSQCGG